MSIIPNPTEWQVNEWMMDPKFTSEAFLKQLLPAQISPEGIDLWRKILGRSDRPTFITVSGSTFSCDSQSILARNRYPHLQKLYKHHCPEWPTVNMLLSECFYLMNDICGARIHAQKAQGQVGIGHDIVLDQCIVFLKKCEMESMKEYEEENEEGDTSSVYRRPAQYFSSSQPSNLIALQLRWHTMKGKHDGAEQFVRLACVQTNELEGVFDLDGDSTMKLTRCGLYANSIEGISQTSRQKKKGKILEILKNTERCFNEVKNECLQNESPSSSITEEFFKIIHELLLGGNNIEMEETEDDTLMCMYIPGGRYRGGPSYTSHEDENGKKHTTCYCPAADLDTEMQWLVENVKEILSFTNIDPFRACAWIQFSFVRIHPFADGNGRVSRLLSSIPLILNDLPPVYVSKASKPKYLRALIAADTSGDIDDLANFLQQEVFDALGLLLDYNDIDMEKVSIQKVSDIAASSSDEFDNEHNEA